jgi:electron transfer flavoprotein alpha subunit
MKTVVCIKQVPFVDQLKFDTATKRLIRTGVSTEINPFDRRAITAAIELRQRFGGEVVALNMGPPQANEALVEALAMGCDRAVHLQDRTFAGSDTLATAHTLALACRKIGFDLILCGKYSVDAETAQVPPMLAELLDVPQLTGVTRLEFAEDGQHFSATREVDDGFETVETNLPALLTTSERLVKPIRVGPEALEPARQKPLEVWGAAELGGDPSQFGTAGSLTSVSEIYSIQPTRKRSVRTAGADAAEVSQQTVQDLLAEGLFGEWKSYSRRTIRPRPTSGARERAIWVVAELIEDKLRPVTFELLGRGIELAQTLDGELAAVLLGQNVMRHAPALAAYGADRVYLAEAPGLSAYNTEAYTAVLAAAIRRYQPYAVLLPSTSVGRDLAPRLAARLNVGLTGDCIGLEIDKEGRLAQLKPAFGGNVVAPILSRTRPAMATLRPGMLQSAQPDFTRRAIIDPLPGDPLPAPRTRLVSVERSASAGVELDNAEIIVSVGMGVGGPNNLPMVRELAETLGAALGASRRVVDSGWLPRQMQVGLTGRSVAPRLYLAVGISGKFNHMVGMQRAGLLVAINNNPKAEIFEQCDYGIVGDWASVVPALIQALRQAKARLTSRVQPETLRA